MDHRTDRRSQRWNATLRRNSAVAPRATAAPDAAIPFLPLGARRPLLRRPRATVETQLQRRISPARFIGETQHPAYRQGRSRALIAPFHLFSRW